MNPIIICICVAATLIISVISLAYKNKIKNGFVSAIKKQEEKKCCGGNCHCDEKKCCGGNCHCDEKK